MTTQFRPPRCLLLFVAWICLDSVAAKSYRRRKDDHPNARNAKFMNQSGAKVDFFWVHPNTGELAHSHTDGEGIVWGSQSGINTFVGHVFEVVEITVVKGAERCLKKECRRTRFTVNENEDQIFTLNENFEVSVEDNKSRSMRKAKEALDECKRDPSLPVAQQITHLTSCMEKQLDKALNQTNEEIEFQKTLRTDMGKSLAQYTCDDPKAPTTESVHNDTWTFVDPSTKEKQEHQVQILFETQVSAVKYIPGIFTAQQCEALLEATQPNGDTERILPASAKKSLPIVEILMKVQNLYKSFLGLSVKFSSEPLLVLESHKAEAQLADGECALCDDKDGDDTECAQRPDSVAKPGVHRKILNVDDDEEDSVSTSLLLVCSTGQGSALHFPRTGTHVATKKPGDAVLLIHKGAYGKSEKESEKEKFLQDLAVCQPWMGELVYVLHQQ